jgi:tRNA-specific 2-thiouridylase
MARVVLAMSGGVDSSVAAWILREQGHEVIGVFMRHGLQAECKTGCQPDSRTGFQPVSQLELPSHPAPLPKSEGRKQGCCSAVDADDARRVADVLGIPFYVLDFQREFEGLKDYFAAEYAAGRTPNPCIECNTRLKFGRLFDYADGIGAEFVATGHYARIEKGDITDLSAGGGGENIISNVPFSLCRGFDESKDQSYVLFGIQREKLPRLKFPIGQQHKQDIRRVAGRLGLRPAAKRDSQEICFVPDQDHARFVRDRLPGLDTSGEIVSTDGTLLGRHDGIERFTVGQRKGLRLAFGSPRYVVRIEADTRRVVIGTREELARRELTAARANWLVAPWPAGEKRRVQVKIRYRSLPQYAAVELLANDRFRVVFDEPCFGIAPGQAAVCYDGDLVLGGGWIES